LALKTRYTLDELLDRHDEDFLRTAYRVLLSRSPDASGLESFLGGLRAGRLSKIDILGRLRFSREGRQRGVPVQGLLLPWLVQTAYRLPVLGYLLAWLNYLARLPRLVGHWSHFEAFVMFRQQEQTAQLNAILAQLETELRTTRRRLAACEMKLQAWEQSSRNPRFENKE
jgi:O-antigen chain-terminating methyltransferase